MANRFRGEVALPFAGQDYTAVMDFNALAEFEAAAGKSGFDFLGELGRDKAWAGDMRLMLWAALRQRHPDCSVQIAGAILSEHSDAVNRIADAAVGDQPKGETSPGNVDRPEAARA